MTNTYAIKSTEFPRSEHVDIRVNLFNLTGDEENPQHYVEIREFIKNGEVDGYGLVIPLRNVADLVTALDQVTK